MLIKKYPQYVDLSLWFPITNARFALNAVNARWGSFYDALYGTDAMGDMPKGNSYDSERGSESCCICKISFR